MRLDEYAKHDALGLAELVRRGETTPAELRDAALEGIARVNPAINAVLQILADRSKASIEAGVPDGPFRGVPFLIKELMCHAEGVPLDFGSRLAKGICFGHDTELMARFRRAGLVLVGTTQTPEMGYNPTTETVLHGPVHNPWMRGRSAGGSSGGSGAAVAAGIVPIAHANDGGGSIRIPASCNGLVGLKPTRDRVPNGPDSSDPLFGWGVELAVSRTVRDTAAMLDAVSGPDLGAPSHPVPPARPFLEEVGAKPGRLRIAFTTKPASGKTIDPECVTAVERTAKLLEEMGHQLVEAQPPLDWDAYLRAAHPVWAAFTARGVDTIAQLTGRKPSLDTLEAATFACYQDGKRLLATELLQGLEYANTLSRAFGHFFEQHDMLLTPTIARRPVPHGEMDQNKAGITAWEWTQHAFDLVPFTPAFNTTGQPAISLPLHWSADGLPIGVQFAARFGEEAALLRLAAQLEEARPWRDRRPPVHVANAVAAAS
jgi:amidase